MPRVWPGVWSALTVSAADLELVARLQVAGRAVDELALGRVDQHLRVREAVRDRGQLGDVVVVVVGEQHVGDRDPVAPRPRRAAAAPGRPRRRGSPSPPGPAATR